MDNTAPVITEARPQPQQFADSQSHADQTSFYTRYFGNRVVNTLCTIASAAALYLMPVAGLLISTIVVIKLIYDRKVSVVPQDEVQPIVSRANDDVRAADSGPLETTSGSRCVIIPQTGPTPSFTPEAEATLAAQTDGKPCPPLTSEEGLPSTQILKSPVLDSKPALAAELEPHEPKTRRQTPDTAISETASQHSLTVDTDNPIKTAIESINNQTTDRSTSPLPELRTSQPLAHSTPSTSPEGALATLSDTEPTGRELVPASSTSASSLNGQSNDFKAFYFTVDVTFSEKDVQVGFKPVNGSQFQSQSGTIATLSMLPESQNALMPGQSNELLTGLTPLELAFKGANGMPSKAEPFVFWVSRDWIRKHMNAGQNGAFLTFNRKQFNNHQLSQLLKPAIENGHQHPMINGATVNGVAPLQRSLKAVDIESSKLAAPEFVLESHDSTSFGEHSTESSPKTLSTPQIVEDKPVDRSLPPVSMVKELCNSSSEPTTDDESDDDTDSISSTASNSEELFYGDSDIDDVLGSSSEDNWSSSEESTEAQVNDEVSSPSSTVAAINKEQTGQLSVAVITSDIQLPAHLKNRKDQKKPKALEQATPLTAPATKEKIDTTFEKLFCFFLGLSDKKKNPSWENTNPYKDKETKTKLKTRYLDRFFTIDQVFGQACDPVNLIRCLMEPFDTMDPNIRWGVMARAVELDDFGALIKGNVEKGKLTPADIPAEKQRELLWTATMEAYLKFLERCQNEYSSTRKVKRTKALPKSINFDHIVLLAKLNCDIEKCSKQLQSFTTLTAEQLTEQKQSSLRALRTKVLELQAKAKEALTMLDALGVDKKLVSNILNPCSDKAEDDCSSKERESHTLHKLLKRIDKKLENFSSETIEEHQNSSAPMIMSDAQTTEVSKAGLLSHEASPLDSHNLVEGVSEPTPDKQTRSSDESSSSSENDNKVLPSDSFSFLHAEYPHILETKEEKQTERALACGPSDNKNPVSHSTALDPSSENDVREAYEQIICHRLGLSKQPRATRWKDIHPYEHKGQIKADYITKMLNLPHAFVAGAEFTELCRDVNARILDAPQNIQDGVKRISGSTDTNLRAEAFRDASWPVTVKYCLDFLRKAERQHLETVQASKGKKKADKFSFDLMFELQKFNLELSEIHREGTEVNFANGLSFEERVMKLRSLQKKAYSLQQKAERFYKLCDDHGLDQGTKENILGKEVWDSSHCIRTSKKVAGLHNGFIDALKITLTSNKEEAEKLFQKLSTDTPLMEVLGEEHLKHCFKHLRLISQESEAALQHSMKKTPISDYIVLVQKHNHLKKQVFLPVK